MSPQDVYDKGKNRNFTVEKPTRYHLDQAIKVNITKNKTHVSRHDAPRRAHHPFSRLLTQMRSSILSKHQTSPKWATGDTVADWCAPPRDSYRKQGRRRNCRRLERRKTCWQLTAMWDLGGESGWQRKHQWNSHLVCHLSWHPVTLRGAVTARGLCLITWGGLGDNMW